MTDAPATRRPPTNAPIFRIMNTVMSLMLKSPLHGGMSKQIALITVTGRKTGKRYTTPVGYLRDGSRVVVFTHAKSWWKNLRGGAPVTLRMQGRDYAGQGVAIEDKSIIERELYTYLQASPQAAGAFGTRMNADGTPNREDVAADAQNTVMIEVTLA